MAFPTGSWSEPPFIIVYGDSGTGKTTDAILSFPDAQFLALPGAMKSARSVGHILIDIKPCQDLDQAVEHARAAKKSRKTKIVVDDLSLLAENQKSKLSDKYKGWDLWGAVQDSIVKFKTVCLDLGMLVLCNAHRTPPETDKDSNYLHGGPSMPTRALVRSIPHVAHTVLRVGLEDGRKPWPGVYHGLAGNPMWFQKDRHHVFGEISPMNLREGLLLAGFELARHPELGWQDGIADKVCARLHAGESFPEVFALFMKGLTDKGRHPKHVRWALRDGRDRFEFQKQQHAALYEL